MSNVRSELMSLVETTVETIGAPSVRQIYLPEPHIDPHKNAEFGLIELADGAVGLFYAWLGESQRGLSSRFVAQDLCQADALSLARLYLGADDISRSVGLATINAITQSVLRRAAFNPPTAPDSIGGLEFTVSDHIGMVGNFPSLAKKIHRSGVRLTVIERKQHMLAKTQDLNITADLRALQACNKIICTAATLINDSIDEVLTYTTGAESLVLIGPSASFFPDPVFSRGVHAIGGTQVVDAARSIQSQQAGEGLGDSARRYLITRAAYPGSMALCRRVAAHEEKPR